MCIRDRYMHWVVFLHAMDPLSICSYEMSTVELTGCKPSSLVKLVIVMKTVHATRLKFIPHTSKIPSKY